MGSSARVENVGVRKMSLNVGACCMDSKNDRSIFMQIIFDLFFVVSRCDSRISSRKFCLGAQYKCNALKDWSDCQSLAHELFELVSSWKHVRK